MTQSERTALINFIRSAYQDVDMYTSMIESYQRDQTTDHSTDIKICRVKRSMIINSLCEMQYLYEQEGLNDLIIDLMDKANHQPYQIDDLQIIDLISLTA